MNGHGQILVKTAISRFVRRIPFYRKETLVHYHASIRQTLQWDLGKALKHSISAVTLVVFVFPAQEYSTTLSSGSPRMSEGTGGVVFFRQSGD